MSAFRNNHERALWLMAFATTKPSPECTRQETAAQAAERAHACVARLRAAELDPEDDDPEAIKMLEEMQRDDR